MIRITSQYALDVDTRSVIVCLLGTNKKTGEESVRYEAYFPFIVTHGEESGLTQAKKYVLAIEAFADFSDVDRVIQRMENIYRAIEQKDAELHAMVLSAAKK